MNLFWRPTLNVAVSYIHPTDLYNGTNSSHRSAVITEKARTYHLESVYIDIAIEEIRCVATYFELYILLSRIFKVFLILEKNNAEREHSVFESLVVRLKAIISLNQILNFCYS